MKEEQNNDTRQIMKTLFCKNIIFNTYFNVEYFHVKYKTYHYFTGVVIL